MRRFVILFLFAFCLMINFCTADYEQPEDKESQPKVPPRVPKREYTEETPGEWKSIANEHLPDLKIDYSKKKENIHVKVPGHKFTMDHYIEKIGVFDENFIDLDVKTFERGQDPVATLSVNLGDHDPEKIKVFVKCNLHDLWTQALKKKVIEQEK